jgi:enoyl-CoA hydratase
VVEEVRKAIAASLADPEVRVVVIASAIDNYFSAGADLHVFEGMKAGDMHSWISLCHEIARLLRSSPKPLLAAINGTAVGGGLEMALHCDLWFAHYANFGAIAWQAESYSLFVRRTLAGRTSGAGLGTGR